MTLRKIMLALLFVVSFAAALETPDAAYLSSFEKWKADLISSRKQNWLPLVGLFWLKPGANTFGSASDNAIILPSGPAHAGVFTLQGDEVSVQMQTGVQAKIGGQLKNTAKLQSDAAPATAGQNAGPTVLELESFRIHVIKRGERQG